MSVHIPVSLLPNSKLTLRDTDCVLNKTDTKYVLAFQFDDCGSSITYFHNKIVVENEINVHKDFGWSPFPIEFDADFKIPISCSIQRTVVIGGEIETVTHDSIVEEPDSNKVVRYTLKEFKTEEYKQEITAFPVKIPINREVFLELSSNASSPSLGIQIDECIATPSVNPKDPVAYPLIKNDCPVSPAAHVVTSTSAVKRRFKIQAFHFSGRVNNHNRVYFHCQVTYCLPYSCPMPTCSRSKRETRISRSRRVRRGVVRGQRRREIRPGSYISLGPFKIE